RPGPLFHITHEASPDGLHRRRRARLGHRAVPARRQEPDPASPGVQETHDRLFEYAGGHLGFYGFLRVANFRIARRLMIGLMDLPDRLWRDAYEDGAHPSEEADEAIQDAGAEMGFDDL
ncbi:hypothetical protein, partial [Roseomonas mucosa]